MIITVSVTLFLSLLTLHILLRYKESRRMTYKIPGPTPLPFLGNMLTFNVPLEKLWNVLIRILNEYYPIVRIWSFMADYIFVRHPDDMQVLLNKQNIHKSQIGYKTFHNDGLVVSGGEKWRQRRKMINPAFNHNLLKVYTEITNEHAEKCIKNIKNQNIEVIPDIVEMMDKLALTIICEAIMGVDINTFGPEKEEHFRRSFEFVSEMTGYRTSRPYIQDWMMKFLSVGQRLEHVIKVSRELINTIIQERREYHAKIGYRKLQNIIADNEDESGGASSTIKRLSVLDLLLTAEMENLIDDKGVQEEIETVIIAGYETSGTALAFALMLLAENKAAQDLARDEVTDILNQTDGILTIADINKLDYLDRCIKETLRLYPSVPIIARPIKNKTKLSNYEIPIGTEVFLHIFSLHRDPNFWPHPEKFDPDRFLPENTKDRHPFAHLPFSAGPRACIGNKFAMLELKAIVARILYNFYIEPVDLIANIQFKIQITLKLKDPFRIKLIKINRE